MKTPNVFQDLSPDILLGLHVESCITHIHGRQIVSGSQVDVSCWSHHVILVGALLEDTGRCGQFTLIKLKL